MQRGDFIVQADEPILITGATGFIGGRLLQNLIDRGFRDIRCFARFSSNVARLEAIASQQAKSGARITFIRGNLLSSQDCAVATNDISVVFHLAAGGSDKSFPDAFLNSVVTTRNLLDAALQHKRLKRFVNIGSLAVYDCTRSPRARFLDEACPLETRPELRGDAYCFAKTRQDELIVEYGRRFALPYVIVRPGSVYGSGTGIPSRVGISTFGVFLHLGGPNSIPLTHVDNCVEAIALAGFRKGIEGQVFNVVDDDLPSSRQFLRMYKQNVRRFRSLYLPHFLSYTLCYLWERYCAWSEGQLPPTFNRMRWQAYWKKTAYSNAKIKTLLDWKPTVSTAEGLSRYFESFRKRLQHA